MKDEFLELVNNNIVITCCWVSELPNWGWFRQKNTPQISTLQLCETWSNVLACVA